MVTAAGTAQDSHLIPLHKGTDALVSKSAANVQRFFRSPKQLRLFLLAAWSVLPCHLIIYAGVGEKKYCARHP